MKKLIMLVCSVFCLTACGDDDPVVAPEADRTVMCYLVADNNLESELQHDIEKMYKGLLTTDKSCTALIYWDGDSNHPYWTNPCILKYVSDGFGNVNGKSELLTASEVLGAAQVVKTYEHHLSTDPNVMTQVLKDMVSISRTASYGLVMGSHGSSWLPTITGSRRGRSFGQDGSGTNNTLFIPEMASAIQAAGFGKLDYILMDACLMGSAEVAYELRNATDYLITSAIEVPAYGFPYESIVGYLFSDNVKDYTENVCRTFHSYYTTSSASFAASVVIDCTAMDELAGAFKLQLDNQKDVVKAFDMEQMKALQQFGRYSLSYSSVDMMDFIKTLNGGEVPATFREVFNRAVPYSTILPNCHLGGGSWWDDEIGSLTVDPERYSGMGVYIPVLGQKSFWNDYFTTIGWYKAAGWNNIVFEN